MACSTLPGGGLLYSTSRSSRSTVRPQRRSSGDSAPISSSYCTRLVVKAVAAPEDCNEEDCAPEKEVGKVSMEWKAAESTKVLGTFPPSNKKKWTGYVEKDTAGQTNIYAVEPTVYVSENVISSNTAGDSSEGSEQTLTVALGLGLGLLVGAVVVLQWVSPSTQQQQQQQQQVLSPADNAPTLTYYIQKFTPQLSLQGDQQAPASTADQIFDSPASAPSSAPSVSEDSTIYFPPVDQLAD